MNSVTEALLYFLDHQKELEKHHPPLDDDKTVDTILHEAENYPKNRKHDILCFLILHVDYNDFQHFRYSHVDSYFFYDFHYLT